MSHTARAQHAADRIAARLGKCDNATSHGRNGFLCDLPAGHHGGHYYVGTSVDDGKHDDEARDQ